MATHLPNNIQFAEGLQQSPSTKLYKVLIQVLVEYMGRFIERLDNKIIYY